MVPSFAFDPALHAGDVGLLRPALFELLPQEALRLFGAGEDDDPGGVAVEAVDEKRIPAGGLQAGEEAVLPAFQLAGDGKEAGGFVEDEDRGVFVQELQGRVRRVIGEVRDQRGVRQYGGLRQ